MGLSGKNRICRFLPSLLCDHFSPHPSKFLSMFLICSLPARQAPGDRFRSDETIRRRTKPGSLQGVSGHVCAPLNRASRCRCRAWSAGRSRITPHRPRAGASGACRAPGEARQMVLCVCLCTDVRGLLPFPPPGEHQRAEQQDQRRPGWKERHFVHRGDARRLVGGYPHPVASRHAAAAIDPADFR